MDMQESEKIAPNYTGKTAVVLGLGKSGLAAAKFLHKNGAKVKISDIKPKDHFPTEVAELAKLADNIECEFGGNSIEFCAGADLVVYSASMPAGTVLLRELREQGIQVLTEVELTLRHLTAPVCAIVGSHGKTSVGFMAEHVLRMAGRRVFRAGELAGTAIESLLQDQEPEVVIFELKPNQLEKLQNFCPKVVALTNLQKKKPPQFATIEDYYRLNLSVLRNSEDSTAIIYNFRDANLRALVPPFPGRKILVRRKDPASLGVEFSQLYRGSFLKTMNDIVWTNGEVREEFNLRYSQIYGLINRENWMFAVNIVKEFGVPQDAIQAAITEFSGVPHRLQFLRKRGGVRFVNDSRSITPDNLERALEAFRHDPIILIAGGKQNPDSDFSHLRDLVKKRVKTMILVGESKEKLNRNLGDYTETFLVGTFEEAVLMSYQKSRHGDVILLSPGCESYDMFNGHEERGTYFSKYLDEF